MCLLSSFKLLSQAVSMFRLEVFLAVLFCGLLLSEIVENISRAALRMYRYSSVTTKESFQKNMLRMSSKL